MSTRTDHRDEFPPELRRPPGAGSTGTTAYGDRGGWRLFAETGAAMIAYVDLGPDRNPDADPDAGPDRENAAAAWLDAADKARWRRFRDIRARREFTLCRAALRDMLCARLDCANRELSFSENENGKPLALVRGKPAPAGFNISHSGPHGLIAVVPGGRVGIDVEDRSIPRDIDGAASLTFTPAERAELAALVGARKTELFYRIWTMKEALIKALGVGFGLNPSRFEIPPAMRSGERHCVFRFPHLPDQRWRLEDLGNADFAAAIATEQDRF